jgi:uncharacterized protein YsxB (DUF464 family)
MMIMITIEKKEDIITFKGHSQPDICASVSSIMYTTVNALNKFDEKILSYTDDKEHDVVVIRINFYNELVDLLLNNMFDMLKDLQEQANGEVQIKTTDY